MLRALIALIALTAAGCGPTYVKGTKIEYTDAKQEIANVVDRYRRAVIARDADALRSLASRDYYENASTTNDPSDDYNYNGLAQVLMDLQNSVSAIQYEIDMKEIEIMGESARVDYEYHSQYRYTVGEADKWATVTDKNRLTLRREDGKWRILRGM